MEQRPQLKKENVEELFSTKFIKVYDLQYEPGRHYYDASRRKLEELSALKSAEELKISLPDAVSCAVILKREGKEPLMLLSKEYRFPIGQFLLSIPAGLLDPEDAKVCEPIFQAATREIREETGIVLGDADQIRLVNPMLFSTPGMTDESNAFVQVTLNRQEMPMLSQAGAVGGECFDGYSWVTRQEAEKILKDGRDSEGICYSVYTWIALMCFVSKMWDD